MSQVRQVPARRGRPLLGRSALVTLILVILVGSGVGIVATRAKGGHRTSRSVTAPVATVAASSDVSAAAAQPPTASTNADIAQPLTLYIVATEADRDQIIDELGGDPLYRGNAEVLVVPPGDASDLTALSNAFPTQRISIVDLRN
jgi:hypothetical protein